MESSRNKKKIKTYEKNGKLRSLVLEILNNKKNNLTNTRKLIEQVHNLITKEDIILQLRLELKYHERLKTIFKNYLELISEIKDVCKKNKSEVQSLSDELRKNFHEDVKIIDKYEAKIALIKKEKEDIIKINDEIIDNKRTEAMKLNEKLIEIETKILMQKEQIEEQHKKISELQQRKESEKNEFIKKENIQLKKIAKLKQNHFYLESRLKHLQEKYKKFYDIENKSIDLEDSSLANNILVKEDREIYLNEQKLKNENLLETFNKLNDKVTKLTLFLQEKENQSKMILSTVESDLYNTNDTTGNKSHNINFYNSKTGYKLITNPSITDNTQNFNKIFNKPNRKRKTMIKSHRYQLGKL
jgi:hypothetical protein